MDVWVVVAYDVETEKMTDANVLSNTNQALKIFSELKCVYGGANVAMFSRRVDSIHMGTRIPMPQEVQPNDH